jgi:dUTP pyrophosphatase
MRFEKLVEEAIMPQRATAQSAGYDLATPAQVFVPAHGRILVKTHITAMMMPDEYLAIVPRSGLALKKGITVLNTPGTIDADYFPGDIGVILYNTTDEEVVLEKGERIAQAIVHKYGLVDDDTPKDTKRTGGFGSTGRS